MKIGIIFFGLPRSSQTTFPSIKKFLLDPISHHELFVECCFSYQNYISNKHSNEEIKLSDNNYDVFKKYKHQFIKPDELLDKNLYKDILSYGDSWNDNGQSLKYLLMQLNCIQKAYLRCKDNDCDFYIFVRPDLIIHESISIEKFISRHQNSKTIMVPSWQWFRGINDRFAITSKHASDCYGLRYNKVYEYCQIQNKALHSESFLFHILKSNSINIKTFNTKMSRVRANNLLVSEEFSVVKRMGGYKKSFFSQMNQINYLERFTGTLKILLYFFKIR